MISSLTSRFRYFDRRALFISAHKIAVYHWDRDRIGASYLFDINDEGKELFERYLRQTPKSPVYILADVFEEEFRRETIPHVLGSDRQALLGRKQDRLFRDTTYIYNETQAREKGGRRDDNILLTAITNPSLIKPWIDILEKHKVPLAGVYSVPLLSASLIKSQPDPPAHVLLVSIQSISGLRQTFIQDGELRISRLVQLPRYGSTPYAPRIAEEVEKIQRYLQSLRLIPADEPLDIWFLMTGELAEELKAQYGDTEYIRHRVLDINELASQTGLETRVTAPFCDQLYVSHLLKSAPANQYASASERRYFSMRRLRYAMLASSFVLMIGGALWSGYNLFSGLTYKQQSIAAELRTQFYSARYNMARQRLPETPVPPAELQRAVEIAETLNRYKTSPLETVKVISRGLNRFPQIQLKGLTWVSSSDPNVELGGKTRPADPGQGRVGASQVSYTDTGYLFYHVALIDGYLDPFDGNFRRAIDSINEFAGFLRGQDSVHDVSIIILPLDVSSSTSLQGNTQSRAESANFSLRIVTGIGNEA